MTTFSRQLTPAVAGAKRRPAEMGDMKSPKRYGNS